MKKYLSLTLLFNLTLSLSSALQASNGNDVEDILLHFAAGSGTGWQFISTPPKHILNDALDSQARLEARLMAKAPEVLRQEMEADYHSVISFYDEGSDLYRIVWYYRWSSDCGDLSYKFSFVTYSGSDSIIDPNIPLTGGGQQEAECSA